MAPAPVKRESQVGGKNGRLGSVKKRTGCKTCKRRKVLCGEERPSCQRCVRAKLTCGGYANFVAVGNGNGNGNHEAAVTFPQTAPPQKPKSETNSPSPFIYFRGFGALAGMKTADCQAFDYCRHSTLVGLHRLDWSDLWITTIPAAAHIEPAVLHAMLALGAAHEVVDKCFQAGEHPSEMNFYRAWSHSGKAMRHLQRLLKDYDSSSSNYDTILIVCYMLLTLEAISGRADAALLHLRHARSIIRHIQSSRRPHMDPTYLYLSDRSDTIEQDLIQGFTRMDIQAINWGSGRSEFHLTDTPNPSSPHSSIAIPPSFTSISDARRYLLILLHEGTKLLSLPHLPNLTPTNTTTSSPTASPPPTLPQTHLLTRLTHWSTAYAASPFYAKLSQPATTISDATSRFHLLQMHHALLTLTITTHHLPPSATLHWDTLLPLFRHIVHLAYSLAHTLPIIGLDMAVIQPALSTAIHCRHPYVRRQALGVLHLLREKKRWDTTLDIGRVEVVIKLEEGAAGYVYREGQVGEGTMLDLGWLIPEGVRCWDVVGRWVDVDDETGGRNDGDNAGNGRGEDEGRHGGREMRRELVIEVKRPVPPGEQGTVGTEEDKHVHRVEGAMGGSPRSGGGGGHEGVSIVEGLFPRAGVPVDG